MPIRKKVKRKKRVKYATLVPKKAKAKTRSNRKIVMCLGSIPKAGVPEIKVRYNKSTKRFLGTISESTEAAAFIKKLYTRGSIELQEAFIVLYLNRRNEIIGYYKHTTGAIAATIADVRIILGAALKSLATSIMIAHNHPSGNLKYSEADMAITKKVKESAAIMDIALLDHIIVTKKGHFSFADEGLI